MNKSHELLDAIGYLICKEAEWPEEIIPEIMDGYRKEYAHQYSLPDSPEYQILIALALVELRAVIHQMKNTWIDVTITT